MFRRQREGSVVCPSCGRLVGVRDARCLICGQKNPSLFGWAQPLRRLGADLGFVQLIVGSCTLLYVASLLLSPRALAGGGLFGFLAPDARALLVLGGSGSLPLFALDRWWTPLSASWLHGGLLHLVFNLLWVRDIAPQVARLFGAGRTVLVYLAGGVGGFVLTSCVALAAPRLPSVLGGAQLTIGASASLFGLFGALVCYGQRTGQQQMRQMVWGWVAAGVIFGFVGVFGGIRVDNWAHAGGFGGGWLAARLLDPLREERPGHLLAALVGLAASLVAVLASVVTGLHFLER